jgi:hypothetical protein
MDSLLFAMFAVSSPLDASVLERQQASGSVAARLQQSVRERFVDRIRDPRGAVSEEDVTAIRKLVIELSSEHRQQNPPQNSFLEEQDEQVQQDVGEFFRFIIDALAPDVKLVMQRQTHHGGWEENDDQGHETLSELILYLGDSRAQHLKWDQVLDDNMTGKVDVRRRVGKGQEEEGMPAFNR